MNRYPLPAPQPSTSVRWSSRAFRDELTGWCESVLGEPLRLESVSQRPWSTVWKVYAGGELYFAKQNCPLQSFEAGLVSKLADLVPEQVVVPVAVDVARDLMLTRDHGAVLGERTSGGIDVWCRVVAEWGALQRVVTGRPHAFDGVGLATFLPTDAEEFVATRTAGLAALPAGDPRSMPAEQARRIEAHLPVVRRWAGEVAALGLPLTLTHNDLHEKNVFVDGDRLRFFDFGDAVIANPLGDLMVPLRMLGVGARDPAYERVAEALLEVWSDVVPLAELRRALPACLALAILPRHETWVRCIAAMNPVELAEFGSAASEWLGTLLDRG